MCAFYFFYLGGIKRHHEVL